MIPEDFHLRSMYTPDAWFIHDLRIEPEHRRVVGICDTTRLGALVDAQRPWPGHEKHVPGAVSIQITGTLGQLLSNYLLDMSSLEGWVGYGTHIHFARFQSLGKIGPPMECAATLLKKRSFRGTVFTRLEFEFTQEGRRCYHSEQTAAWIQSDHRGPCPEG